MLEGVSGREQGIRGFGEGASISYTNTLG
jgi:hypothetical protein